MFPSLSTNEVLAKLSCAQNIAIYHGRLHILINQQMINFSIAYNLITKQFLVAISDQIYGASITVEINAFKVKIMFA